MSENGTDVGSEPLAIVCGGGTLPYSVADAAIRQGRRVVLFPLRGFADGESVKKYPHHWMALGQYGGFRRLARKEGCRDAVFVGSVVRPSLSQVRLDFGALSLVPRLTSLFRGGDNHLLSGLVQIMRDDGFRVLGAHEVAPEILVPLGVLGRYMPSERDRSDIARGLALIATIGEFDVGQAAVVADNHVIAVEAVEGTDHMLSRIAELRKNGRLRVQPGIGVLVKAPKPGQDRRVDLPSIGPKTIAGVTSAGLAGLAVVAGSSIIAESHEVVIAADRAGIFVVGVGGNPS